MDISEIDDSKYEIQDDFICKYCQKNSLVIPDINIWKLGMQLYYTLVEPLEDYVFEKKGNRLAANSTITECEKFPKKDFDVMKFKGDVENVKEIQINGFHSGLVNFDTGLSYMCYCERPNCHIFTYKGITMSYSHNLQDAMPKGWLTLPGSERLKIEECSDFDNWLFYERAVPLEKDRMTYQVVGWNKDAFSLFFTFEKDKVKKAENEG
jgi:hypothetical protein